MTLKILQLNIWQGAFIQQVIDFIKERDIDIAQFQEASGARLSHGGANFYPDTDARRSDPHTPQNVGIDCFEYMKNSLPQYEGEKSVTWNIVGDQNSYTGDMTFVKKDFPIQKKDVIWYRHHEEYPDENGNKDIESLPREALALTLDIHGSLFTTINTHVVWSPRDIDTEKKRTQTKRIHEYMKKLDHPFVLTGDFNASANTKTVSQFEDISVNLSKHFDVTNTLNPRVHNAQHLFPKGLAVDFIFVDKTVNVKHFEVLKDLDLSDHLGLVAEIEL